MTQLIKTLSAFCGINIGRIAVFGAGKSGLAIVKKLGNKNIFLSEGKKTLGPGSLAQIKKLKVPFELGGHTDRSLVGTDLIIVSPGIPLDIPILLRAKKRHIPIIGEIELAFAFLKKPMIAVTGTNGKTTTATLLGALLSDHGYNAAVAGNIGKPLISVNDSKIDFIVVEASSYQLETVNRFRPWISMVLNITEDHLTRHRSMNEYALQKSAIFRNQRGNDRLIYNFDDALVRSLAKHAKCKTIAFSRRANVPSGTYVKNGAIFHKNVKICSVSDIRIKGDHNLENSLAAISAAILCKVPASSIINTLKRFKGVEHRIEYVRTIGGISYFNDSKGTNPDSTITAINALSPSHKIILILGGRDKKTDLGKMCGAIKEKVKDVVLLGEAKERFKHDLAKCGFRRVYEVSSLRNAVFLSRKLATKGEAVLLSPACASFDMFNNYEERGKVFKKIVANL